MVWTERGRVCEVSALLLSLSEPGSCCRLTVLPLRETTPSVGGELSPPALFTVATSLPFLWPCLRLLLWSLLL